MAPKRNSFQSRRQRQTKRKKLNLIALRQKNDFKMLGESHPADTVDTVKTYTKIEDEAEKKVEESSSSSESEEEVPALKQLLDVIGSKEEDPESEEEGEDESSEDSEEEENSEEETENRSADDDIGDDDDVTFNGRKVKKTHKSKILEEDESDEDIEEDESDSKLVEDIAGSEDINSFDEDDGKTLMRKKVLSKRNSKRLEENESDEENEKEVEPSHFIDDEADEDSDFDDEHLETEDEDFIVSDDHEDSESCEDLFFENDEEKVNVQEDSKAEKLIKKIRSSIGNKVKQKLKMESNKVEENSELSLKESDPFSQHFEIEIEEDDLKGESLKCEKKELKVPVLGKGLLMYKYPQHLSDVNVKSQLKQMHVKQKLCDRLRSMKKATAVKSSKFDGLSSFQHRLFSTLNSYQDLLFPKQDFTNGEDIRLVYCLHSLNHSLKTRSRIIAHNTKLKHKSQDTMDDIEYRDQGLTRPKVLILLPYRDRALKVFQMLLSLLSTSREIKVSNRKRFEKEFSELEKRDLAAKRYKSEDFIKMFEGNVDDNFKVGMSISKNTLRLYSPFYESDIILSSPLGLRTVIGNEGDAERDFDFLSSIEILIMDQTDVFLMQNWDHVSHIFRHLHLQPKETHGTDFSRVRMWAIDGLSKHFRQTVIFSNVLSPEIMTIFNKQCHNYTGKLLIQKDVKLGTIGSCLSDASQIFHRIPCDKPDGMSQRNAKLDHLKRKILPHHTSRGMNQTLIYCSYFSFVLLRNYFREADVDFLFINEYDSEKSISNTRKKFRQKSPHFMLYTERLHFHHRFRLKGINHIVWFDMPLYPQFYTELVNLLEVTQQTCTSTCLFTKYDGQKLLEIVGQRRAAVIVNSEKSVHMITVS